MEMRGRLLRSLELDWGCYFMAGIKENFWRKLRESSLPKELSTLYQSNKRLITNTAVWLVVPGGSLLVLGLVLRNIKQKHSKSSKSEDSKSSPPQTQTK